MGAFFDGLFQDARYALRGLRRAPVLTGAIVLTLAFGIGMNAGVFSVINGMVFRARVEKDPASFFQVLPESGDGPRLLNNSAAEFQAYRSKAAHASELAAWSVTGLRLNQDTRPSLTMPVSCEFFELYGLERAKLGRLFQSGDCAPTGSPEVAILSEELWRSDFYSIPAIVGSNILLGGRRFTVVGIVPARFAGRLRGPGIWTPFTAQQTPETRQWLTVEGWVRSGASREQVRAELESAGGRGVTLTDGSLIEMPGVRTMALWMAPLMMAALTMILLLACTNVTMLLLSRAVARRYEMGVRLAMGASRGRLLRMAATEGVLLAFMAGVVSAAVAGWVPAGLERLVPQMPHYPMHPDWRVFTYLAGVTLLAGCLAGLMPAAESFRVDLHASLKHQESAAAGSRWRLRDLLICTQVAFSMVLLVGAALFLRTEYRLFRAAPGFDANHVMVASLPPEFPREFETRIHAIPGVRSVAFAESLPYGRPQVAEVRLPGGNLQPAVVTAVSPGFFGTLGIPLVSGREFRTGDVHAAIVPESFARQFWKNGLATGREFETADGAKWRVAGVAGDSDLERHGTGAGPRFYQLAGSRPRVAVIRFDADAAGIGAAIRACYRSLKMEERELPRTLAAEIAEMGSRFRAVVAIAIFLGGSAFLLAVIGVYGVISFAVSRRRKEMGIRLALGATRTHIVQAVMGAGARPVIAGLVTGLPLAMAGALGLAMAFRNTPASIAAWDGVAYGSVAALLAAAAGIAMVRPAWKASGCDPALTLKDE